MRENHLFIADMHYGQSNIHINVRPEFNSAKEHDDFIHDNICKVGDKTKTLWLLGDTFLKPSTFWRLEDYRRTYQYVNIILGNHCHPSLAAFATKLKGVNVHGGMMRFGCWLTHLSVNPIDLPRGNNIHAHNHARVTMLNEHGEKDNRYYCVSAEVINYTPISLYEIKKIQNWR